MAEEARANEKTASNPEEGSLNANILYYLIAPLVATFIIYLLCNYIYSELIKELGGPLTYDPNIYQYEALNEAAGRLRGRNSSDKDLLLNAEILWTWTKAGNIFVRIFPFIAYGTAAGSILLIPSSKRKRILGRDKISCAIRANCVSLITVLVMLAVFGLNPFSEKLSEQTLFQGVALYWSQIFAGLGMFLLCQQLLLKMKTVDSRPVETVQRGLEKTASVEEVYIHKPESSVPAVEASGNEDEFFIPKPSGKEA